jgi:hypothetical protein
MKFLRRSLISLFIRIRGRKKEKEKRKSKKKNTFLLSGDDTQGAPHLATAAAILCI